MTFIRYVAGVLLAIVIGYANDLAVVAMIYYTIVVAQALL